MFVLSRYKGPKIFFACGALRIPRPNFYLFGAKSIRESFSSGWFAVFLGLPGLRFSLGESQ